MTSTTVGVRGATVLVRQFAVTVVAGADRDTRVLSQSDELSIGTNEGNDLRLTDPSVSRHHCSLKATAQGLQLRDLGSRNGTFVGDVEALVAYIKNDARIRIGQTTIKVEILDHDLEQPIAMGDHLGPILGGSPAMRRLYPVIEQCGGGNATVLITGETGTGKELIAEAIHATSARRKKPFVVVDCSALSHDLAESELFGHERGAFTGADAQRVGAFETADGGTIFLDEIGELPFALQPLLLRALENRTIRRIGSNDQRHVDVRVIAASHRDLRELVNVKRFRSDLFYRINVIKLVVPPLRERTVDIPVLAGHFWRTFRSDEPPAALLDQLARQSWPGNVRELRNAVERAALIGWSPEQAPAAADELSYQQAKERAIWEWEAGWVEKLINAHAGNLSRAARAVRMGRSRLRELARRHGVVTRASAPVIEDEDDEPDDDPA